MPPVSATAAGVFRGLDEPDAMEARATAGTAAPRRSNNTHIHLPPNFSAFDTVHQAVDLAASQGIAVLGVSNYYHYGVYDELAHRAHAAGIFPLFGTEVIALLDELVDAGVKINDPGNPGKMYLCGKGITGFEPLSMEAHGLLADIRDRDSCRMADMVARLDEVFAESGFDAGLTEAAVKESVVRRHGCPRDTVYLQERHVAQAFQEVLAERLSPDEQRHVLARAYGAAPKADLADAVAVQNEMRAQLMKTDKPAYIAETFVGFDHAYKLILALGGIPCYPVLADGAKPTCPYEQHVDKLVAELQASGVHCVEFIPLRNQPAVLGDYVRAMRAAGMVITAGTEHNTRDLVPLEPTCVGGQPVPDDVADLFWEGACVVAAHQYLVAHGRPGFVDEHGTPNAAYPTAEARIAAFDRLGATVVEAYLAR